VIRVAVVDDQTLIRQGLRSLLELTPDIRVAAEASDGEEALSLLAKGEIDVALLDVRMPRKTGVEVLEAMRPWPKAPPAIVLTTFDDDSAILAAVAAGAKGFLLKDVTRDQLAEAIRAVARGETLIQPAVTERVLKGLVGMKNRFPSAALRDPLTRREIEILRMLAGGFSNKEIARALGTAEGTVKNHTSSIFGKLGVRDRIRAVLKAIELGLI
jgi:DNA-binding NarL/FixJ family response regulator